MDQPDNKEKLKQEIKGMMLGAAGLFILVALLSFNTNDSTANSFSSS